MIKTYERAVDNWYDKQTPGTVDETIYPECKTMPEVDNLSNAMKVW